MPKGCGNPFGLLAGMWGRLLWWELQPDSSGRRVICVLAPLWLKAIQWFLGQVSDWERAIAVAVPKT